MSDLAEKLVVSRRTVHLGIATGQPERDADENALRYRVRPAVDRKIDPCRGIIQARMEAYPRLSAVRLYDEIRQAGYEGGYTQFKDYMKTSRPMSADPAVRFETTHRRQAQVDLAHSSLHWGRR